MQREGWSSNGRGCVGASALVAVLFVLPVVVVTAWIWRDLGGGVDPACDADPIELSWTRRDGRWWRSDAFELEVGAKVLVHVALAPDGGLIQSGQTVAVAPANDEPVGDARPTGSLTVGSGVDAVDEIVDLPAGTWELAVSGAAGRATVQFPC